MQPASHPSGLADAFDEIVDALVQERDFAGLEVVASKAQRNRDGLALSVMVDRIEPNAGVDIATCERVAARINAALETFSEHYTLEVESAGLDRPLVKPADYERFREQNVRIVSTLAIRGAKTHRGRLRGVQGRNVVLLTDTGDLLIPLEIIKSANVEFDIRNDLARAKRAKHAQKENQ